MTPDERLADRRWRYLNSWWIFPPVASLGFLGWLGFFVAAIRTGKRSFWVYSLVYLACITLVIVMLSIDEEGTIGDLAIIPLLAAWLGATLHAALLNRSYLKILAEKGTYYHDIRTARPQAATALPWQNSDTQGVPMGAQPFLGVAQDDYYAPSAGATPAETATPGAHAAAVTPPPQPTSQAPTPPSSQTAQTGSIAPTGSAASQAQTARLDVSTASADQLAQVPGVDLGLAHRIVAVREARGGYRNLDDLVTAANLQPHELTRIRDHLTFPADTTANVADRTGQADHATQQAQHRGRILDL